MNKGKLRSLMFHAGFCNEDGGWDNRPIFEQEHDNFQRFAELIVRECLTVINQPNGVGDDDVIRISEDVKKHFGVEE